MSIKDDLNDQFKPEATPREKEVFKAGAKWMAERIAHDAEPYSVMLTEHIRKLKEELES